jgi:VWFA-related protein
VRTITLFLLASLLISVAGAAGTTNEISVTLVEIPVEVTRGGKPAQGLTAADFEVVEKGGSLPIVAFEPIDVTGPGSPGKPAAAPPSQAARRHLFLLFDFALSSPERLAGGIAAARDLVAHSLDPSDLVAVGIYLPKGELPVLLNFTADRTAADRTLAALEGMVDRKTDRKIDREEPAKAQAKPAQEPDPLRLTGLGVDSLLTQAFRTDERNFAGEELASLGRSDGSKGSFLQHNVLGHTMVVEQVNTDARQRDHVMALAETMAGLADVFRPVAGRKILALFSEGFSMSLADRMVESVWTTAIGGSALLAKLHETLGDLQRSGWVLDTVSLWGTRAGLSSDGLFFLANETGGVVVEGTNDLAKGLDAALQRSAHGYVLTVQVDVAPDGSYHPLEVRLRNESGHARVHHRGGYFAPLPFREQKDMQRLTEAARMVAGDEERNELGVQAVAVPLRSGGGTTPVAIVIEVPGAPLLAAGKAAGARQLGLEVYGYALTETGGSSDYFAQAVSLDPGKVGPRLTQGGVRILGQLNLTPGEHRLRVLVRDRGDGRLSLLTIPLSLSAPGVAAKGATGEAQARLDALFLSAPGDPWLLVRPADMAFEVHGRSVVPATQAALPAAGEVQIALLGTGFTSQGQWIRGRILTAEGKPTEGGAVDLLTVSPGEAGEPDLVLGRLRAGTLPAGDYMLELRLGKKTGVVQASTVRPFLIR